MAKDFVNITDTFNLVSHSTHKGGHTLDLHLCSFLNLWCSVLWSCSCVIWSSSFLYHSFFKIYVWLFVLFLFVPIPQLNRTLLLTVGASIPSVLLHDIITDSATYTCCFWPFALYSCTPYEGSWEGLSWHQLLSGKRSLASCPPPPFASLGLQAGPVGGLVGCSAAA